MPHTGPLCGIPNAIPPPPLPPAPEEKPTLERILIIVMPTIGGVLLCALGTCCVCVCVYEFGACVHMCEHGGDVRVHENVFCGVVYVCIYINIGLYLPLRVYMSPRSYACMSLTV